MAIKGNNSSGLISALSTDFIILQNTSQGRWAVSQLKGHAINGTGDSVEFYKSPDATIASGGRIDLLVFGANETKPSLFTTFDLEPGEFLVGNAAAGALVNVEAIYITYDGDS